MDIQSPNTTSSQSESQTKATSEAARIAFSGKYTSSLDKLVTLWIDEYNNTTHRVKDFQYSTIKTYLWIATVIFAAELAF